MRLKNEFKTRDLFMVDPKRIREESGWNVRRDSPDLQEHVAALRESIRALGVLEPLTVYAQGEELILINGHCRLDAVRQLLAEGAEIETVPVRVEERGTNDADRVCSMLTRNSGKELTTLEKAEVCKRLLGYGWDPAKIAGKIGRSPAYVNRLLDLLEAPAPVLKMVEEGTASASLAAQVVQENGPQEAPAVLQQALKIAQANGGAKAQPKHVRAAQGKGHSVNWEVVGPKLDHHLVQIFNASREKALNLAISRASAYRDSALGA
jgi:ParB family chromosome partitioning protein